MCGSDAFASTDHGRHEPVPYGVDVSDQTLTRRAYVLITFLQHSERLSQVPRKTIYYADPDWQRYGAAISFSTLVCERLLDINLGAKASFAYTRDLRGSLVDE